MYVYKLKIIQVIITVKTNKNVDICTHRVKKVDCTRKNNGIHDMISRVSQHRVQQMQTLRHPTNIYVNPSGFISRLRSQEIALLRATASVSSLAQAASCSKLTYGLVHFFRLYCSVTSDLK